MALYETQLPFNRQAYNYSVYMGDIGTLTDAAILSLTTVAGLRAVTFVGYETQRRYYEQWQVHVDRLEAIGIITDALVGAADTLAGLLLLMTAVDANLVAGKGSYVAA